ncbi:MAG TPA: hypothetical protein VGH20_03810 [Myxococcales bacterium]|jgi:hypothetical protein
MLRKASVSILVATALLAASCGGSQNGPPPPIAGSWREPFTLLGSFYEMTLLATDQGIGGTGVAHVEAGPSQPFRVVGTSAALTLFFPSGRASETYAVQQPDQGDLQLVGQRTIAFIRVQ